VGLLAHLVERRCAHLYSGWRLERNQDDLRNCSRRSDYARHDLQSQLLRLERQCSRDGVRYRARRDHFVDRADTIHGRLGPDGCGISRLLRQRIGILRPIRDYQRRGDQAVSTPIGGWHLVLRGDGAGRRRQRKRPLERSEQHDQLRPAQLRTEPRLDPPIREAVAGAVELSGPTRCYLAAGSSLHPFTSSAPVALSTTSSRGRPTISPTPIEPFT
jgi:hypothetical protein